MQAATSAAGISIQTGEPAAGGVHASVSDILACEKCVKVYIKMESQGLRGQRSIWCARGSDPSPAASYIYVSGRRHKKTEVARETNCPVFSAVLTHNALFSEDYVHIPSRLEGRPVQFARHGRIEPIRVRPCKAEHEGGALSGDRNADHYMNGIPRSNTMLVFWAIGRGAGKAYERLALRLDLQFTCISE